MTTGTRVAVEVPIMKTIPILVALVLTALPATAQSRVYTNADLTSGAVTWTRTVTAEELRGLEARQFRSAAAPERPVRGDGPTVTVVPHTPWFPPFAATSEPTRPLSEPWSMTTYLGHGGYHDARPRAVVGRGPGVHLVYGTGR
jgi:hypothetical protein